MRSMLKRRVKFLLVLSVVAALLLKVARDSGQGGIEEIIRDALGPEHAWAAGYTIDVTAFEGAVGDGVTDDAAAIQRAVSRLTATGGVVWLPPNKRYAIGSTINIQSKKPIFIVSQMGAGAPASIGPNALATYDGGYLRPLNDITLDGMFKWSKPAGASSSGDSGGGGAIGLNFYDTTGTPPGRNYSVFAALNFTDCYLSIVRDCNIHWIKGHGIFCDGFGSSHIDRCNIRYCGNTGKSALQFGGAGDGLVYACTVRACVIEGNYLAPYVNIASGNGVTLVDCTFEADPTIAGQLQKYIVGAGGTIIENCVFGQNTAQFVELTGVGARISGCSMGAADGMAQPFLTVSGEQTRISDCRFTGDNSQVGNAVLISGQRCVMSDSILYVSGNLAVTGVDCTVSNVSVIACQTTETHMIKLTGTNATLIGAQVDGTGAGSAKGIYAGGIFNTILGCRVYDLTAVTGIESAGGSSVVANNDVYLVGTPSVPYALDASTRMWNNAGNIGNTTAVGGAATLNKEAGTVTTENTTNTPAGSTYMLTLTNNQISTGSIVTATVDNGGNNAANSETTLQRVTPAAGSCVFLVKNTGTAAYNGSIKINFQVRNP